jgi:transcriptional regulatory protein LevR
MRAWLASELKVQVTDDELDVLAIFLNQLTDQKKNPGVWITLVTYNTNLASSYGKFMNSVFSARHIHWVDGKNTDSMHKMFEQICDNIRTFHGETGNLILTDMDVLSGLEYEMSKTTGVLCRVIPSLEHHLLITAYRITLSSDCALDEVYRRIGRTHCENLIRFFSTSDKDVMLMPRETASSKVVLTVCVTGVGSAQSIKEILEKKLSYIFDLTVIAMSSLDNIMSKAKEFGSALKLIVGTVNPDIPDVPFVSADRIFTVNGMYSISAILEDWSHYFFAGDLKTEISIDAELDYILNDSFGFIAPSVNQTTAITCISKMIDSLETEYRTLLPDELKARLFMHAASMLERVVTDKALIMDEEAERHIEKNIHWFMQLEKIISESFHLFAYVIPREEHYYFMLSLPDPKDFAKREQNKNSSHI